MNTEHAQQPGDLDPVFNNGYVTLDHTASNPMLQSTAETADGGVLAVSTAPSISGYCVSKFTRQGRLDPAFGNGGAIIVNAFLAGEGRDLHVLENGAFLVMGRRDELLAVTRFNADGSIDTAYGVEGHAVVRVADLNLKADQLPPMGGARPTSITDGGRIYLGFDIMWSTGAEFMSVAVRLDERGRIDTAFNKNGFVMVTLAGTGADYNSVRQLALQPDGKLVIAVQQTSASGAREGDNFLVRYHADGALDYAFGGDGNNQGVVRITAQQLHTLYRLQMDESGWFKVIGSGVLAERTVPAIRSYTANGHIDAAFNHGQTLLTPLPSGGPAWFDGTLFGAAGSATMVLCSMVAAPQPRLVVVRLLADGRFDTSFGREGSVELVLHAPLLASHSVLKPLSNGDLIAGQFRVIYRVLGSAT